MLKHYFTLAVRNLLKYKTQNIISVIGLAVGIFCFTVCLYLSRFGMDVNKCFTNYGRIAVVQLETPDGDAFSGTPAALLKELRNHNLVSAEAATLVTYGRREAPFNVEVKDDQLLPYDLYFMETDSCYNALFTPTLLLGNWQTVANTPNAVVMARTTAERIFGSIEAAMGKRLISTKRRHSSPKSTPQTGGIAYTVQAVMEDLPLNTSLNFLRHTDILTVNDSEGMIQWTGNNDATGANTFLLLAPGKSIADLQAEITRVYPTHPMFGTDNHVICASISMDRVNGLSELSMVIAAIGTLILLVGFLNFFQFLVGSFLNRTKEYSLMKLLGINRKRLFLSLFIETLLVICCTTFLALWLVEVFGGRLDFDLFGINVRFEQSDLYLHTLQYAGLLVLVCSVISFFAMLRIRRITVLTGIFGGNRRRGKNRLRNTLLGVQFFICWLFVAGALGLFLLSRTLTKGMFYSFTMQEKQEIVSVRMDYDFLTDADKQVMIDRFRQSSGIKEMMLVEDAITETTYTSVTPDKERKQGTWITITFFNIPPNFFSFMNISLLQGRSIKSNQEIVVDERFLKEEGGELLGKPYYNYQGTGFAVCGVTRQFINSTQDPGTNVATVFSLQEGNFIGHCYLKCHPGRVAEVKRWVEGIRRELLPASIDPTVTTLLDDIHYQQSMETGMMRVILFFAVVCVIITLLGVYSSISLDTERRQKEIAIRKVNGAKLPQIMLLFLRLYIILLVASAVVAFPLIYLVVTFFKEQNTVFFDDGFSYWAMLFLGVAVVTFLTIVFRILKIARRNPAEVIKRE